MLELAVYHLGQKTFALYLCCFVVKLLLFCFHQRTPLDWAAQEGHEEVVACLKRAADPNMLEVST